MRDAARRQGVSEADVVWDFCGKQEQAKAHKTSASRRKANAPVRRAPAQSGDEQQAKGE